MTNYAFKFGYEGSYFTGFQRGNGDHSVEDTIIDTLKASGFDYAIKAAARTDRYVSALSNVFSLETGRSPEAVAGLINSRIDHIYVHSYAEVPDDFNPRHCTFKTYRYYILRQDLDCISLDINLGKFIGTHDFRRFVRADSRNTVRTIINASCKNDNGLLYLEFSARSFLWNQIRTMVAFILDNIGVETDPFSTSERYPRVARAQNLLLWDIYYDGIEFRKVKKIPKKMQGVYENSIMNYILAENLMHRFGIA
ncbi:pseudouridine synthase family protein [Thermoplasma acidophilum]|uniref:tRNA pseudouridine synthase A n=1 Tax=Thermoplasma acidophilum (strain ATCC 25905 / DSM 1728 / JCM 9062 / NBRC 15155 / AMRC-C165) TaxID=273075 RepID=TRUA_THEAC|nr:tRNA pseudouridine(38-40) synthase TruA [Thermoplasma acidophilum]Q9HJN5.2 RecName: Full=tRNA pseudouridine synthase A; AltName: Full=tRNA pseudouridine(38-40) synthase; AltName: Full=tRNA pseudouridylate synthase I; AltName: Full=tRNA-uridine isomerase I [Thermoplasma acidophilum DSM 1728]MCY0852265.1 tRNA pseudouridine(38-40) synthase TruA [Thermoplasma acidophilum]